MSYIHITHIPLYFHIPCICTSPNQPCHQVLFSSWQNECVFASNYTDGWCISTQILSFALCLYHCIHAFSSYDVRAHNKMLILIWIFRWVGVSLWCPVVPLQAVLYAWIYGLGLEWVVEICHYSICLILQYPEATSWHFVECSVIIIRNQMFA